MIKLNQSDKQFAMISLMGWIFIVMLFLSFGCSNNNQNLKNEKNKTKPKMDVKFSKNGELTFNTANGDYISTIDIEIADDDAKRSLGLMFRSKMEENQGMLFIFPNEDYQSFWMRNTEISLDLIFVNEKNEIVTIRKNAEPFSDNSYPSTKSAKYVVEVNGGYSERLGIKEGDKITWRRM